MDPDQLMEWLDNDNDEILASLQTSIFQLMQRRNQKSAGGSTIGRRDIFRNRLQGDLQLHNNYFSEEPIYPENLFRQRFRMRKELFLKIVDAVTQANQYFVQKRDAAGRLGFLPIQKVTAALRLLAYGYSADSIDEYLRIG